MQDEADMIEHHELAIQLGQPSGGRAIGFPPITLGVEGCEFTGRGPRLEADQRAVRALDNVEASIRRAVETVGCAKQRQVRLSLAARADRQRAGAVGVAVGHGSREGLGVAGHEIPQGDAGVSNEPGNFRGREPP